MKILMLFPYAPLPPPLDLGGTKRNLPFLLELAKYNDVTVLSFGTPGQQRVFEDAYGSHVKAVRFVKRRSRILNGIHKLVLTVTGQSLFRELYHRSMQQAIDEVTAETRFDVIHCCVQMFGRFRFPPGIPVSSDTHEVKHLLFDRTAHNMRNPIMKRVYHRWARTSEKDEFALCKRFDLLITTTSVDYGHFRRHLPNLRMMVIHNGAGESFFEGLAVQPEPASMTFTGLFTHVPNREGILYFLDNIFPLILQQEPHARIFVVGKGPTREILARASDNVIVTGFVDDVRPYMARAQVFVIPLLAGGGIRGKALEAMAMKRPIVATTVGVEGIDLEDGTSALFGDTPQDFAAGVLQLLRDPALRIRLAEAAHQTALAKYTWAANGRQLHDALTTLVETYRTSHHRTSQV